MNSIHGFGQSWLLLWIGIACIFSDGSQIVGSVAEVLPYRGEILKSAKLVNDYWITHNGSGNSGWARAAYYTGNQRIYEITEDPAYLAKAVIWGEDNAWLRGPEGDFHADAHCCGQTYIDLYRMDPQPVRIADMVRVMDLNVQDQRVDRWHWIDAFYMAAPTLAKLAVTLDDPKYTDKLWVMYEDMGWRRGLFDTDAGLWYRDSNWFYPGQQSKNGKKVFWSRGNGWVIAGIARVLAELPEDHPRRMDFISMFRSMAAALVPLQGADGFWRASLLDPDDIPNPETSGTGFFTFAIAWGIRKGHLDENTYMPVVVRAWNGLNQKAVHPDGFLGYVQTPDDSPAGADYNVTRDFGVGAFLLAASELSLLAEKAPFQVDAGASQQLVDWDGDGWARVELTGSIIVEEDLLDTAFSWWIGEELIADGEEAYVELPLGSHQVQLLASVGQLPDVSGSTTIKIMPAGSSSRVSALEYQEPNRPENLFDGNLDTRLSIEGTGKEILFSWLFPVRVNALNLAFFQGNERKAFFDVEVSSDGNSWVTVLANAVSNGMTLELQRFAFEPVDGRYLRILGNGNSQNLWNSYTEAEIEITATSVDQDGDEIPDVWELNFLGSLRHPAHADRYQNGLTLLNAYRLALDPWLSLNTQFNLSYDEKGRVILFYDGLPQDSPGYDDSSNRVVIQRSINLNPGSWEYYAPGRETRRYVIHPNQVPSFFRLRSDTSVTTGE